MTHITKFWKHPLTIPSSQFKVLKDHHFYRNYKLNNLTIKYPIPSSIFHTWSKKFCELLSNCVSFLA